MGHVVSSNHNFIKTEVGVRTESTFRGTIRTGIDQIIDQIVVTEDNTNKTKVGPDMKKIIGEEILEET